MPNYHLLKRELTAKIIAGEVTKEDVTVASDVAKALGTIEDRMLYVTVKQLSEKAAE